MTALEPLALLPLAFWIGLALDRSRAWPREFRLPDEGEPATTAVVAIVPARDETDVLPRTLPSLIAQDHARSSIIVVDDGSSDGTAETATRIASEHRGGDRVRVLTAPPKPIGWSGKLHAVATGVREARAAGAPEWLLLTDADIHHRPGSVRALVSRARAGGYDLVSVMARLHAESRWERLLIPPFVFFFQLLYPFRRIADPRSGVAGAAGGCVLVRDDALRLIGGIEAIHGALIDDVALGRAVKRAGGRTWLGFDDGIVSLRRYPALGDVWQMVARTAFDQLGYRYEVAVAVFAGIFVFLVSPPLLLVAALAGPWDPAHVRAAAAAAGAWGLSVGALLPSVRHHHVPARWAATLPLASFFYALMTATSAWDHLRGRGGRWKGRVRDAAAGGPA
ncbi:MAG: hypothetical protein QOD06_1366 [Candidatus Binatota bacterium]|jgi:hopene-associated glycosyltransferase HpnB|nr:hypothetical protein [Candidatus Binatota bacterium]